MLDWVIVGGGPHGLHLAVRLLGEAGVRPEQLRIVDPGARLMETWRRCTGNTGMAYLRSPGVHQLDLDPFSLVQFAKDQPVSQHKPFARPYGRPALGLFTAHCDELIEAYGLASLHERARVTDIALDEDGAIVTLDTGGPPLRTRRVLLALGASEHTRWPDWAKTLPDACVQHVFQRGFSLDPTAVSARVAVIGAGITAAQTALRLSSPARQVTLVARHAFRKHQFDSDPGWVGPKNMRRFIQTRDATERRRMIQSARHRGSLPPDLYRRLHAALERGHIQLVAGEVSGASSNEAGVVLEVGGKEVCVDDVLLATGFDTARPGGALVDRLVQKHSLPCATCGFPLVDPHLRWHPGLFVTGPLAELEVGPVARNLIGARRAAERIVPVALSAP
jgi:thioredoxin reductase